MPCTYVYDGRMRRVYVMEICHVQISKSVVCCVRKKCKRIVASVVSSVYECCMLRARGNMRALCTSVCGV